MRMLLLARRSDSPLYIVHVSSIEGIEAIAEARGKRLPVYGELLHNYLAFCDEDYDKPNSMIYHNYPALKSAKDRAALWEALRSGVLDVTSSDDFTIPFAQKIAGERGRQRVRRPQRHRDADGLPLLGRGQEGEAQHQSVCRRVVDRGRQAVRHLSAQGHHRDRQRRRHRDHRSRSASAT